MFADEILIDENIAGKYRAEKGTMGKLQILWLHVMILSASVYVLGAKKTVLSCIKL